MHFEVSYFLTSWAWVVPKHHSHLHLLSLFPMLFLALLQTPVTSRQLRAWWEGASSISQLVHDYFSRIELHGAMRMGG